MDGGREGGEGVARSDDASPPFDAVAVHDCQVARGRTTTVLYQAELLGRGFCASGAVSLGVSLGVSWVCLGRCRLWTFFFNKHLQSTLHHIVSRSKKMRHQLHIVYKSNYQTIYI